MKLRTKLTKGDLRTHLLYFGWVYVLIAVLSFGLWNLIYAQTAYRPPQDARIDVYIQSSTADQDTVNAFLEPIWKASVPEEELVNAVLLMGAGGDNDYYANIQLVTYIAAAEGDIYMLSSADFKRLAAQGAFVALDEAIEQGIIDAGDLPLNSGKVQLLESNDKGDLVPVGGMQQFGIPARDLYRFATDLAIDNRDMVLAVAANSGNEEDTITFLNALIQATRAPIPDFFK